MSSPRQPLWYSLLAILATAVVLASSGFWYTNHVQRQTEQKLCRLTAALTTDSPPPTTERAKRIALAMDQFRADLDC